MPKPITGDYSCPVCGFVLHKRFLCAEDGAVGISRTRHNVEIDEKCPNDGFGLVVDKEGEI